MVSRNAFVAHPIGSVTDGLLLDELLVRVKSRLEADGWSVASAGQGEVSTAMPGREGRFLQANIDSVITCNLLVILASPHSGTSSIWIEMGMALAAGISIIIIRSASDPIPYLAELALLSSVHQAVQVNVEWVRTARESDSIEDDVMKAIQNLMIDR